MRTRPTLSLCWALGLLLLGGGCQKSDQGSKAKPAESIAEAASPQEAFGRLTVDELVAKMAEAKAGTLKLAVFDNNGRADGVALVYGFPNGNSAPGFFSKLGWRSLDPVPFLIKPLRSRYFLARVPKLGRALARLPDVELRNPFTGRPGAGGLAVEPIRRFDAATDAVWRDYVASCGIAVVRDSTYLNWRFFDRPGEGYEVFGCRDASGRLRAFAALAMMLALPGVWFSLRS